MIKKQLVLLGIRRILALSGFIFWPFNFTHATPQILFLPVKIYCYSFTTAPELNCTLGQSEIKALMDKVNHIWKQAGIQWTIESIVTRTASSHDFPPLMGDESRFEIRERLVSISPKEESRPRLWKIAIIGRYPGRAGGVNIRETHTTYFVERTPRGTKGYPMVLAHELGHSLGLQHTNLPGNLMQVGKPTDMPYLTKEQIEVARVQATKGPASLADLPNWVPHPSIEMIGPPSPVQRRQRIARDFRRFDIDDDGIIREEDIPYQAFPVFDRMDRNQDGKIDAVEMNRFVWESHPY